MHMEGGHAHHHDHDHGPMDAEKSLALLKYMLDHNRHHAEELHDAGHALGDEAAAELIHEAVHSFEEGNRKLEEAIGRLEAK